MQEKKPTKSNQNMILFFSIIWTVIYIVIIYSQQNEVPNSWLAFIGVATIWFLGILIIINYDTIKNSNHTCIYCGERYYHREPDNGRLGDQARSKLCYKCFDILRRYNDKKEENK